MKRRVVFITIPQKEPQLCGELTPTSGCGGAAVMPPFITLIDAPPERRAATRLGPE
ncbi:MAG: hypothetical protein IIU43_11365 [Thermoguttaceae bacterium]|nr:hypothetical protein [Thermoguttaceae bacterium]MBQ5368061.1 hypothetical protein [Thermoguttaceae bacterium]